jgi:ABC-2 type transport system permease protein
MNISNITTIIRKEWAELYKNTLVLSTVLFMPFLFAVLPLAILWSTSGFESSMDAITSEMPAQFRGLCEGLTGGECNQVFIASQFTLLFMFIPLIVPATIAPYAIVGEKTQRSLEPLLATPITTVKFLVGKMLAAIIPGVLATWAPFAVYMIGARFLVESDLAFSRLFSLQWLLAVFIAGPLLAVLSATLALMVSSRSNEPRAAQQVASLIVIPLVLLFIGQMSGLLFLSPGLVFIAILALIIIDMILIYLAVQVFDREAILTRWA